MNTLRPLAEEISMARRPGAKRADEKRTRPASCSLPLTGAACSASHATESAVDEIAVSAGTLHRMWSTCGPARKEMQALAGNFSWPDLKRKSFMAYRFGFGWTEVPLLTNNLFNHPPAIRGPSQNELWRSRVASSSKTRDMHLSLCGRSKISRIAWLPGAAAR